ncbi:RnfABCDGE type electron transport complex subunit A [candidate division WOR-3 bacterium]|jgi:electron transport complex protein RnfA|nr:RnfABCDGE type electron transport complex subunit A [candidate division WOR-3 bacterium]NOR18261.1 RnfABCDGE type electron transport complex subunit A [candidate division WOR-3 bacterium]
MKNPALIFLGAFLINNIVLMRFLGLCPFFGVSTAVETATGMGMAVIFVMTLASWITWIVFNVVLLPLNLVFLRTAVFILTIASLVQLVEMFLKKYYRTLYNAMGIYLPLITTNCAILGITFLNIDNKFNFLNATVFAIGTGIGFMVVMITFAAIRERLDLAPINPSLKGYPISFIAAGLMALAFLGFSGLFGLM